MKILLITHIYPPAVDGGSKVITNAGKYFKSQGHQTLVLTTNCRSTDDFIDPASKPLSGYDSNVIALPVYKNFRRLLKSINLFLRSDYLSVSQKGPIFKMIPFIKSLIIIIKFHPDLIMAGPLPTTIVLYASLIAKITSSKLLINGSFHSTDPDFTKKPLIRALRSADYLWTLTDHETEYFHQNFRIPVSKMINVGIGIDKSLLKSHPFSRGDARRAGGFNLLFIGSFAAHKGIATLIDSFIKLPSGTHLTIAGQKTLFYPVIRSKIQLLPKNIQNRIKIILNFKDKDLPDLIDQCTILISPSTQESFGLVLLESWARKKPVIAADIPASFELINKTNGGLTFTKNDSSDLAKKIKSLLKNKKRQQQLGQNGFNYVQEHATWDKIGQALWSKISSS